MSIADLTPASEHKIILKAFSRAIRRELHVFTIHPDLFWQQLYNHLQWEGQEIKNLLSLVMENVGRITRPRAGCQPAHRIIRFNLAMVTNSPRIQYLPIYGKTVLKHFPIELIHRGKQNGP